MKWLKALGAAAAAVAVGLVIWLVVGNDVANRREIEVMQAWAQAPGSFAAFLARYPFEETNEAAHRLEAAADPLGLDLRPPARPLDGSGDRFVEEGKPGKAAHRRLCRPRAVEAVRDGGAPVAGGRGRSRPDGPASGRGGAGAGRGRAPVADGRRPRIRRADPETCSDRSAFRRVLLASALREASRKNIAVAEALLEASWALNVPLRAQAGADLETHRDGGHADSGGSPAESPVSPGVWIRSALEVQTAGR